MNFLDRITDEAFRELVSFELPSIVSVFLNTCFCSLVDSMYSYSYNMYIFQDAYRDEIIFMGTFKIGLGRISGSAGLSGRMFNFAGYPACQIIWPGVAGYGF